MKTSQGLVAHTHDLRREMSKWPTVDFGFICPFCFANVQKSTDTGGFMTLWCDCYARVYTDPGRVALVTLEVWTKYIAQSENYAITQVLNRAGSIENLPVINVVPGNYDIWCPGCGRARQLAAKGIWLSKASHRFVCAYGICDACMKKREQLNEKESTVFIDAAIERLIAHYPGLDLIK